MMTEIVKFPDVGDEYRAAIVDWVEHGASSRYVMSPDEVVARSVPRGADEARAAACFELGEYLRRTVGEEAAVPWWREAHRLYPGNWTYKRQAWTLVTTPEGQDNDLIQGPNDVYEGNWLDDVIAGGGGETYTSRPSSEPALNGVSRRADARSRRGGSPAHSRPGMPPPRAACVRRPHRRTRRSCRRRAASGTGLRR